MQVSGSQQLHPPLCQVALRPRPYGSPVPVCVLLERRLPGRASLTECCMWWLPGAGVAALLEHGAAAGAAEPGVQPVQQPLLPAAPPARSVLGARQQLGVEGPGPPASRGEVRAPRRPSCGTLCVLWSVMKRAVWPQQWSGMCVPCCGVSAC